MRQANGTLFDEISQLERIDGKRKSQSPDNKNSVMGGIIASENPKLAALGPMPAMKMPAAGLVNVAADLMPVKQSGSGSGGGSKTASKDTKVGGDQHGSQESDSFYKMYNKEIKVNQDEIPIILSELTDAAYNFIQRENYEKALILLQKTEGVLEVVSLEGCSRDKYISFITYINMSMCFQKLGMLEECIFYLKQSIALVSDTKFYKNKRISQRNRRVNQECKLKLQLCAILSQNQNHSEALENARKSVRLSHQMFKDMEELCQIYIDKINYRDNLLAAQEQSDLEDAERMHLISMVMDSSPAKEIPKNFLEQSISLVERSSLKMFPVIREVRRRVVNSEVLSGPDQEGAEKQHKQRNRSIEQSSEKDLDYDEEDVEEDKPDMRSVLGFLNQNEWIYNLNIGNIMQIQPISMKEFLHQSSDEMELSRDSFLSKLSILIVTYFCMSTEMRFLLQSRANYLKPEVKKERELESEFWHAKALEIACTFLPSECPLLNHVLLSYQKHHDPTMQPIKEDEESTDVLSVLRPLKGIEQSKYQPIVRILPQVKVSLSPQANHIPLKQILRQFEAEMIDEVLAFNSTKLKRISSIIDKEVQAVGYNENSPTQANLSAIVLPNHTKASYSMDGIVDQHELIGVVDNSNMLPLSLTESQRDCRDGGIGSQAISHNSNQTSTMKLKQEMYLQNSMLEDQDFNKNYSSIEGLEQQLMAAVDSPSQKNMILKGVAKFPFDSRDESFGGIDSQNYDEEGENKLYDMIIAKVLSNPRIDKKTLLKKFISKIEMESNIGGGLSDELSQIKKMINIGKDYSIESVELIGGDHLQLHAVSHVDPINLLLDQKHNIRKEGVQSMQQINPRSSNQQDEEQDSELLLNVPSEVMSGQIGVQDARASRENYLLSRMTKNKEVSDEIQEQPIASALNGDTHPRDSIRGHKKPRQQQPKPSMMNAKTSVLNREQQKSRIDASVRTRSSSHNLRSSNKRMGQGERKISQAKASGEQDDFRKVKKSYLEDESLFKDIERSTEYQDPLNLNIMDQSANTDAAPVDVDDIQFEQKSSGKSNSRSNSKKRALQHHMSIQSSTEQHQHQTSSNKKSNTFSRPSTATNGTRHSSVNIKKGRKRNNIGQAAGNPQKTLIAKELEDQVGQSRSESSSRGRFQKQATRFSQNQASDPKENVVNFSSNSKANGQQRLRHSQARKRLSVNHHQLSIAHGQSVEHPPEKTESRSINKASSKRINGGSKHHNLSVQAAPQHGMTSKIKKLVSHKQIETNIKRQIKKQKLSQTKNLLQPNKMSTVNHPSSGYRGRASRQLKQQVQSKSNSRSSGKRTYSGSSRHLKSRSNHRSSSENRRNLHTELAQYSFDIVGDDQVNINAVSAQQLISQHSKSDLARQVLENQKTILGLIQKRTNSNDSMKSRSQNRKKSSFTGLSNIESLIPKRQTNMTKIQRLSQHNIPQAHVLLQAHVLPQTQLGGGIVQNPDIEDDSIALIKQQKIGKTQGMQNSASQHVQGLSNFIKQINSQKRSDQQSNKSLQYLKRQQKFSNTKGTSQPPRSKALPKKQIQTQLQPSGLDQNKFKQNLMNEIRHLQNRLQEHIQQTNNEPSPNRQRSGSNKRSEGNRSNSKSRSRSRSPTQPTKAIIPKKKSFSNMIANSKNMNFTTNEVAQLDESLLNMSTGEQIRPSNRAHATSKQVKRKFENLIHQQAQVDNLAYTSFEEAPGADKNVHTQLAVGQGNTHHSLSMFDSEVSVIKVNQFAPLHHQLSQNAILASQPLSKSIFLGQMRSNENPRQNSKHLANKQQVKLPKRQGQNPERRQMPSQGREVNYRTTNPQLLSKSKLNKN